MKLISWNVNGLRACMKKGFEDFFKEVDADIFCVQETSFRRGRLIFARKGTNVTGTTRSAKDTPAPPSSQRKSRWK